MQHQHRARARLPPGALVGAGRAARDWLELAAWVAGAAARGAGGFTEFIPLPFVHMAAPMFLKGEARKGPTFREAVLMHAVARLALHPVIGNIQVSWVKMGGAGVTACLEAGANDLGGTLMNESISRAAGTQHGQEFAPARMDHLIRSLGREPQQRTTLYGVPSKERTAESYRAAPLVDIASGREPHAVVAHGQRGYIAPSQA